MTDPSPGQQIRQIVTETPVGMLSSFDADGRVAARPMLALLLEDDPRLYFLTAATSTKVSQITSRPDVSLTFAGTSRYLAMLGEAEALTDAALAAKLWNPTYRAWFPHGPSDPEVTVLRVTVVRADYWEAPASKVLRLVEALTAMATGTPHETPRTTVENPQL